MGKASGAKKKAARGKKRAVSKGGTAADMMVVDSEGPIMPNDGSSRDAAAAAPAVLTGRERHRLATVAKRSLRQRERDVGAARLRLGPKSAADARDARKALTRELKRLKLERGSSSCNNKVLEARAEKKGPGRDSAHAADDRPAEPATECFRYSVNAKVARRTARRRAKELEQRGAGEGPDTVPASSAALAVP